MIGTSKKFIVVEAERADQYDDDSPPVVRTKQIEDLAELAKELASELANWYGLKALLENEQFVKALDAAGFRNLSSLEKVQDKVVAEKRFFLYVARAYTGLQEVDLEKLTSHHIDQLASNEAYLLQSIGPECIKQISPDAWKKLVAEQKRRKKASLAAKKAAATKIQNSKAKRIEEAEELLRKEGLLK